MVREKLLKFVAVSFLLDKLFSEGLKHEARVGKLSLELKDCKLLGCGLREQSFLLRLKTLNVGTQFLMLDK